MNPFSGQADERGFSGMIKILAFLFREDTYACRSKVYVCMTAPIILEVILLSDIAERYPSHKQDTGLNNYVFN